MIRARLERFDFPLCASKPGCELSKAAGKAAVKTRKEGGRRGRGRGGSDLSLRARRLKGMQNGREATVV